MKVRNKLKNLFLIFLVFFYTIIISLLYFSNKLIDYPWLIISPTLFCIFIIFLENNSWESIVREMSFKLRINKNIALETFKVLFIIILIGIIYINFGEKRYSFNLDILTLGNILYIFLLVLQEEIIFRGFIESRLMEISSNLYIIIISYILWAVAHVPKMMLLKGIYYWDLSLIIITSYESITRFFFPYIAIRYLNKKTDSLTSPIIYHFSNNLFIELVNFM